MEKVKRFYRGLSPKRKMVFWVCIGIVSISVIRIGVWQATKGVSTNPRQYLKKLYSQEPSERKLAMYMLGISGIKQSLPELEKILKEDRAPDIKRTAAWSIGKLNMEKLISLFDSTEKGTKDIVMETLLNLDKNNIYTLLKKFPAEDMDTKVKILTYAEKSKDKNVYKEVLKIGEAKEEAIPIRKEALEIAAKNIPFSDIESTLWNLYYNDPEQEIKEFSYTLIKELKEKK